MTDNNKKSLALYYEGIPIQQIRLDLAKPDEYVSVITYDIDDSIEYLSHDTITLEKNAPYNTYRLEFFKGEHKVKESHYSISQYDLHVEYLEYEQ